MWAREIEFTEKKEKHIKLVIALLLVFVTISATAQAAPNLNNEITVRESQVVSAKEVSLKNDRGVRKKAVHPKAKERVTKKSNLKQPKGCEKYRKLISRYNWNKDVALRVMRAESGCNPGAVGDNRVIGGVYAPSCGLFQIRTLKGRPNCAALQEPKTNVRWAYKLYSQSRWRPWSVCRQMSCR